MTVRKEVVKWICLTVVTREDAAGCDSTATGTTGDGVGSTLFLTLIGGVSIDVVVTGAVLDLPVHICQEI